MTILAVADLREHVTTELSDEALVRLLNATEEEIVAWAGAGDAATEILDGGSYKLILLRPAASITSIVERRGTTDTTLAVDDYQLYPDGYVLERLTGGTNSSAYWRGRVTVTYVPLSDSATREIVQVDLVKLSIATDPALAAHTIGAFSETFRTDLTPDEQRNAILARLSRGPAMAVVGG